MAVRTTADEKIDEAKDHISKAYKCLLGVLDEETWGHRDLNDLYINTLLNCTQELINIKKRL